MKSKSKIGYGVEMFYVLNNADEFKSMISHISMFTEREILNAFEYPLVESGFSFDKCEQLDKLRKKNSTFIKKPQSISIEKSDLCVTITISSAFVEYCVFDLPNKFWGSYDVNFKKAAVITAYRNHRKKMSQTMLNDIEYLFNKIPD